MTSSYTLAYGTHATPDDGRCAMEWVSFLAGEPHSDDPSCVSPVLRAYCTALNDSLDDGPRQRLRPYLTRTIGTAGDGLDGPRSWTALDWLVRTFTPAWLAAAGLDACAEQLAALTAIEDSPSLDRGLSTLREARLETRMLRAATLGPARPAVWSARAAGRVSARETAWGSAGAAAWAAARVEVGDMAGDRARALAREIAADAAIVIASAAPTTGGRAAARAAARAILAPTLTAMERSALALLDRMLPMVALEPLGSRARSRWRWGRAGAKPRPGTRVTG
jgi:hypothetical protein